MPARAKSTSSKDSTAHLGFEVAGWGGTLRKLRLSVSPKIVMRDGAFEQTEGSPLPASEARGNNANFVLVNGSMSFNQPSKVESLLQS